MRLDDFTMIIPTYNRPNMLANVLELYTGQNVEFQVVVADSSATEIQEANGRVIERHGSRVRHLRFDPDYDVYEKFQSLPDVVDTRFGMYAADDDIVILGGVIQALDFLRSNDNYVACHGVYYSAQMKGPRTLNLSVEYAVVSHEIDDTFGRMLSLSVRYQALFYAVMRRETLSRARVHKNVRSAHFGELYTGFRTLIEGKVKGLTSPFLVRNGLQGDVSLTVLDRNPSVWIARDSASFWNTGYLPFRSALTEALEPHVRAGTASRHVDVAYSIFFWRMYHIDHLFSVLSQAGELSTTTITVLKNLLLQDNLTDPPSEEALGVVRQLLDRGWPAYS